MKNLNLTFTVPVPTNYRINPQYVITINSSKLLGELAEKQLAYIDEAVLKSNLDESKTVLKYIMEK